jgi:hypothetical protein
MPLDEIAIRDAKPREKPFKLLDGPWLYLVVNPSGRKFWRLEFHMKGRERALNLGDYPDRRRKPLVRNGTRPFS